GETVTGIGLSGASGSGFSGTLTFNSTNGTVTGMTIQNPGSGYTTTPTTITNFNGCNSLTLTTLLGKVVQSVSLSAGGAGYTSTPPVSFTTGTGTSAAQPSATATTGTQPANAGQVLSITVTNGGSGYTSAPTVTLTSATGSGASATANLGTAYYKVGSVTVDE